jgi:hypothetical protein
VLVSLNFDLGCWRIHRRTLRVRLWRLISEQRTATQSADVAGVA